ncbi:MAG: rhodanese-like domain-containing protein [Candidatus Brocadiales bacterium]
MGKGIVMFCGVAPTICNLLAFGTFLVHAGEVRQSTQLLASDTQEVLEISVDEAAEGIVDGRFDIVLDVRRPEEYEEMHILGALLIPLNTLEEKARVKLSDMSISILTYCRSGRRSAEATKVLRKIGYTDVVSLKGGIIAWKKKGYPVAE